MADSQRHFLVAKINKILYFSFPIFISLLFHSLSPTSPSLSLSLCFLYYDFSLSSCFLFLPLLAFLLFLFFVFSFPFFKIYYLSSFPSLCCSISHLFCILYCIPLISHSFTPSSFFFYCSFNHSTSLSPFSQFHFSTLFSFSFFAFFLFLSFFLIAFLRFSYLPFVLFLFLSSLLTPSLS
ncbi:unnamed protein product [Acanthosepion pharaonis]|uniref:Uncharacterized protein n=1 Tax=Acanthosepion pharaonis TaxID=158019 RepID=A0A812C9T0_ACAPH|nr:unnamed protein product [Sepia pharaonis]